MCQLDAALLAEQLALAASSYERFKADQAGRTSSIAILKTGIFR